MKIFRADRIRVTRTRPASGRSVQSAGPTSRTIARHAASLSPVLATLLLTGAVFLLPGAHDGTRAHGSDREILLSATHMENGGVETPHY